MRCYLCGTEKQNLTKDHVIPSCLFPSPKPDNLITLPCCWECQTRYSKDEEYFRNNITAISDLSGNPKALEIWQKARKSYLRRPSILRELLSRLMRVAFETPQKIYLGHGTGIKIDKKRTNNVLYKITRGLYTHHTGKLLPDNLKAEIYFNPEKAYAMEGGENLTELMKSAQHRGYFDGVFSYAGAFANDSPSNIWWLVFYRSIIANVIFIQQEDLGGNNSS